MIETTGETETPGPHSVLESFIENARRLSPIQTYEELQSVVSPEVTSALAKLILENGYPSKYPQSGNLAILKSKQGRRMVKGVVKSGHEDDKPTVLYLAEFKRRPIRFKRTRWIMTPFEIGVSHGSAVDDGEDFYMPALHSDETIAVYRDEIGEKGSPQTGLEMAGESIRKRPQALNSFLDVTAMLTADLIRVTPAH